MSTVPDNAAPRIAVIGGGLAGLTAALHLSDIATDARRPIDVTLFEAADRLGGAIETVHERGYLVERGADSFLTKPAIVRLCDRLGLSDELLPTEESYRGALVLRDEKPIRVPEGFNLMAPAKAWPIITTPLLSPAGKFRLLAEVFVPRRREATDESLASFARRRLGNEAFERLVQPLVAGIYTADPENLSLAATLPRFLEMERQHGSLVRAMLKRRHTSNGETTASGARYGLFAGLRGGMEQLFSALRRKVEASATIYTAARVLETHREGQKWRISIADDSPSPAPFDAVIAAVPAYRAEELLAKHDRGLASLLGQIPYASSAIVVTGHALAEINNPLNAFGLVIPSREQRDILAVSFASRKFPARAPDGRVLLRTFVGGATRPELLERSDDDLISLVRQELATLLGVRGTPDLTLVARHPNAMPQYHLGHLDLVSKIEAAAAAHPGFELTGSAYRGVGIPDVVADAERAARAVIHNLMSAVALSPPSERERRP